MQMTDTPLDAGVRPFTPRPFHAARWLPGGPHGQTIAGRYLRRPTGVHYERERVETPDGDFLDLDHARVDGLPPPGGDAPVALLMHGLEGSSRSTYVLETCRALAARGIRAVALNFRSCGGEPNRLARFYHAGETGDAAFALERIAARYPGVARALVGFSLGGNAMLKLLGERGADAPVRAAVAVSVPYDLAAGARAMDASRMGRFYQGVFLRSLRRKVQSKAHLLDERCDTPAALRARTFWAFDDASTARLHGFRDAADYYARSSASNYLAAIRVPTLLVHAEDDPFLPPDRIPREAVAASPWLQAAFTRQGGHVGFLAGHPLSPEFWAEREAARFLAEQLGT